MGKTVFAFDVGNGYVKAKSDKRVITAPSQIAKESSLGDSSIQDLLSGKKSEYNVFSSPIDDGQEYIWGKDIDKVVDPKDLINTYTHNDRYNQTRFKLLCLFILSDLSRDYTEKELEDVLIVTGMPSQEIKTEDAQAFKSFLQQKHVVTCNNVQKVINVTDVRIVEQPVGTLLNLYMNDKGEMHKNLLTSTITVVDFGAGTTILDTFNNLKRLPDKSETYYQGMNDVHRKIAKKLENLYNVKNLSPVLVDEGFRKGNKVAKISERKQYLFEEEAKEVVSEFVNNTLSDIDTTLTTRDSIDEFVLTGGGVNIVGSLFKDRLNEDRVKVVKDSQQSNVNGFYKLAKTLNLK